MKLTDLMPLEQWVAIETEITDPTGRTLCIAAVQPLGEDYDNLYGMGSIAFKEVRKAMDDVGYRGWFVMEGTKMPMGVEESCRYDAKYLRMIFPRKA